MVRFLDDPGPIKLPLSPARYTTSTGAVRGSWCLQFHVASAVSRGIQRNVDDSRGAAVVDFHAAAALNSFPVLWVLPLGLFMIVSASWELSFLHALFLVSSAS